MRNLKSIMIVGALSIAMQGCATAYVQQGEVGLLVDNMTGRIDKVLEPGYRMSMPIGQHIVEFPVIKQQYVMIGNGTEGQDDAVKVNSLEGQAFLVDASVDYQIITKDNVIPLYKKYAMSFDNIVATRYRSKFNTAINNAFSALPMAEALTRNGKIKAEKLALDDLRKQLSQDGIDVSEVMIRGVHAPEAISQSIAAKTQAENELVKSRTVAQQQVVEAQAEAQAKLIRAKAEATANREISNSLSDRLVRMRFVEKLSPNIKLVVPEKSIINFGSDLPNSLKADK